VKVEAAALSVRAQRCQSHYFSATPRNNKNFKFFKNRFKIVKFWEFGVKFVFVVLLHLLYGVCTCDISIGIWA
jgi:hypothetical protein